ncbi:MAG: hypothetical protein WBN98_05790, partial [Agathobacter rectalis]
ACLFSLKFLLFLIFSLFSSLALSTTSMPRVNYNNGGISVFAGIFCKSTDTSSEVEGQNKES